MPSPSIHLKNVLNESFQSKVVVGAAKTKVNHSKSFLNQISQDPSESWWTKVATGYCKHSNQTPRCLTYNCSVSDVDLPWSIRKAAGGSCTSKVALQSLFFIGEQHFWKCFSFWILFYFPKDCCKWYILWKVDCTYLRDSGKLEFWAHPASNLLLVFQWEWIVIHLNSGVCDWGEDALEAGMPGLGLTRRQSLCLAVWHHHKLCQHSFGSRCSQRGNGDRLSSYICSVNADA